MLCLKLANHPKFHPLAHNLPLHYHFPKSVHKFWSLFWLSHYWGGILIFTVCCMSYMFPVCFKSFKHSPEEELHSSQTQQVWALTAALSYRISKYSRMELGEMGAYTKQHCYHIAGVVRQLRKRGRVLIIKCETQQHLSYTLDLKTGSMLQNIIKFQPWGMLFKR
jgi:hypothetical protein